VNWRLIFTKQAQKDARKLAAAGLRPNAQKLLDVLPENPFQTPPPFERLVGDLAGVFSRRINIQHRLAHRVFERSSTMKFVRMWTHYEFPLWRGRRTSGTLLEEGQARQYMASYVVS